MKQRILTAIVLIIALAIILFFAPKMILPYLMAIVLIVVVWEWIKINKINNKESILTYSFTLFLYALALYDNAVLLILSVISLLHYLYSLFLIYAFEKKETSQVKKEYLTIIGPLLMATFAASFITIDALNVKFVIYVILIVGMADSGAYFVGKAFGKTKLCQRTSPKKTVEGMISGLLVVLITSVIAKNLVITMSDSLITLILISLLIAVLSVLGDLFESLIKRQNNIKDSSNILPGHGGILDRIDGLIPTMPLFVLFLFTFGNLTL